MKGALVVILMLLLIGGIAGAGLVSSRNQLVSEKNNIDERWAEVDNTMKRRADLIPNLVETVKGYAKQEQTVIGEVTSARSALLNARSPEDKISANNSLSGAIGRLLVLQENYPDLKSNENFRRLMDELSRSENRIALARHDYNEAIRRYNTDVELFPKNIAASLFGFQHNDSYFRASDEEKKVPAVRF
ncbi:MAG TPA: LemA family protein [Bryobacteraceae bacterium]|jgi:LemA protein|nr:LemA family protein [Bryobacteraceae bacterium]